MPVRNVPLTQRFEEKVEVALVPVPSTSRNPAMVEVAVVEVAVNDGTVRSPVKTPAPVTERGVPGDVVPIPTLPPFEIVKYEEVALSASDDVPIWKAPLILESNQCFKLEPSEGLEMAK